jgi:hypothetical protein
MDVKADGLRAFTLDEKGRQPAAAANPRTRSFSLARATQAPPWRRIVFKVGTVIPNRP